MNWIKRGLLIKPGRFNWVISHIQNPFVKVLEDDIIRVFFAGRDRKNRARGGYCDVHLKTQSITSFPENPILDLGTLGAFDDCGVMPSCIINHDGQHYMYYTGWSQSVVTPFTFFIGLAISKDNGKTFQRESLSPVLGRNRFDPYLTCSPWVIFENGVWRMWYVSGTGWEQPDDDRAIKHFYYIKYAESKDGINWDTNDKVAINFQNEEYAIARPVVLKEDGLYKMWYCYRGGWRTYRAGYAESKDGIDWVRKDELAGIDVSDSGWDSHMICYPSVFDFNGRRYMLYNGNNYGQTGTGLAILEK